MPFTPFHMGPGCAIKAVLGRSFSLTVFGFAQVAMDVQPLVHLLLGQGIQHGISHSYAGAAVIGVISLLVGRPVCQWIVTLWKPDPADVMMTWLRGPAVISWRAAATGALLGTFSHVLLDSMVHADVQPWAPFSDANTLLGTANMGALHLICVGIGILGGLGLMVAFMVDVER